MSSYFQTIPGDVTTNPINAAPLCPGCGCNDADRDHAHGLCDECAADADADAVNAAAFDAFEALADRCRLSESDLDALCAAAPVFGLTAEEV